MATFGEYVGANKGSVFTTLAIIDDYLTENMVDSDKQLLESARAGIFALLKSSGIDEMAAKRESFRLRRIWDEAESNGSGPVQMIAVPNIELERWLGWMNTQSAEPDSAHWEGNALECMDEVAKGILEYLPKETDDGQS